MGRGLGHGPEEEREVAGKVKLRFPLAVRRSRVRPKETKGR